MEYTVQKLAKLAGVSTRTLRYYDEIGLLEPARVSSSGYRIYGEAEVDRLQQILFYRELGISLDQIAAILAAPDFNRLQALQQHREQLLWKRRQLDMLLLNVEQTIAAAEGGTVMRDQEKFTGFKQKLIADNEAKYGKEIREKYGKEQVQQANRAVRNMTQEQHAEMEQLAAAILRTLHEALQTGDPAGELAQQAAHMHRQWISFYWGAYDKDAHAGLAQMYVEDERFTAYYDREQPGTAVFLRDAVQIYTRGL